MVNHPSAISGVFRQPFPEQVAYFRGKLGNLVPTAKWDDIQRSQHDRAFMVAGATKADLLADLAAAVDKSISQGTSIGEFRNDFKAIVEQRGWTGWTGEGSKKGQAWRTKIIYTTNAQTAYNAGRYAQLQEFDYWVYKHNDSVTTPRIQHKAWDGLILPRTHVFWTTHSPQNGWGCKCYVVGARSPKAAYRLGGIQDKTLPDDWSAIDVKTGAPVGIDKGWNYQPGRTVTSEVSAFAEKIKQYPALIGAAYGTSISKQLQAQYAEWLQAIQSSDKHGQSHGMLGVLHKEDIIALAALEMAPQTAEVMIKPGLIIGPKAKRHEAKGDAITQEQWDQLPELWKVPTAVLFDTNNQTLIYLLQPDESRVPQLAVNLNYLIKKDRKLVMTNEITSAYQPTMEEIKDKVARGRFVLLRGTVE